MADLLFSLKKLALSPYFVNANLNKSKKIRVVSLRNALIWDVVDYIDKTIQVFIKENREMGDMEDAVG